MTTRLNSKNKVVGVKQVKRALNSAEVEAVYVANDAEKKVTSDIVKLCEEKQIQTIYVDSMKKLGKACGIDINAAVAALLK
jgi:large subunit ribosomal protein L7A